MDLVKASHLSSTCLLKSFCPSACPDPFICLITNTLSPHSPLYSLLSPLFHMSLPNSIPFPTFLPHSLSFVFEKIKQSHKRLRLSPYPPYTQSPSLHTHTALTQIMSIYTDFLQAQAPLFPWPITCHAYSELRLPP